LRHDSAATAVRSTAARITSFTIPIVIQIITTDFAVTVAGRTTCSENVFSLITFFMLFKSRVKSTLNQYTFEVDFLLLKLVA